MSGRLLTSIIALLLATVAVAAPSFPLAREGQPAATIVIAAEATPSARFAAAELQAHVKRITGAMLPIATDAATVTGPRILVGESDPARALRLRGRLLKPQEYVIRYLPDTLVLLGRDDTQWDTAGPTMPDRVPGKFGGALEFDGRKSMYGVAGLRFQRRPGTLEAWVWLPGGPKPRGHDTILRLDGGAPWTYHIIQRDMDTSRSATRPMTARPSAECGARTPARAGTTSSRLMTRQRATWRCWWTG